MALDAGQYSSGGVVLDADGRQVVVTNPPAGATTSSATTARSVGIADTLVIAANASRREITVVNDGANIVYLALGRAAVAGNGIRLNANGGSWTSAYWDGEVRGIAVTAATNVTIAEF